MSNTALATSVVLISVLALVSPQSFTSCTKGRATTYTQSSSGACNFGNVPGGVNFGVPITQGFAIQEPSWLGAAACGECYAVSGPSSTTIVQAIVQDLCPTTGNEKWCSGGDGVLHMDMLPDLFNPIAASGLGVVYTSYKKIPCPIPAGTNIALYIRSGSGQYYIGITAINHRYAISKYELAEGTGAYTTYSRNSNNFIEFSPGRSIVTPLNVRLTSINGDVVTIPINTITSNAVVTSNAQFPLSVSSSISCNYVQDSNVYSDALNSGLSAQDKKVAQDWYTSNWSLASFTLSSTTSPRSGTNCIQAQFTSYGGIQLLTGVGIPLTYYTGVTFWIRADSAASQLIVFSALSESGAEPLQMQIDVTTSWVMKTFTFPASLGNVIKLKWQSNIAGNTPNVYLDDINLVPATTTPTTSGPATTSAPATTKSPSTTAAPGPGTTKAPTTSGPGTTASPGATTKSPATTTAAPVTPSPPGPAPVPASTQAPTTVTLIPTTTQNSTLNAATIHGMSFIALFFIVLVFLN